MSCIDRFLFSADWEEKFSTIKQHRLTRLLPDHFPIMLECGQLRYCRRPFCFENMWLKSEGFVERVKGWWRSYHFQGTPSYVLAKKLKFLKVDLKRWNEESFGNVVVKSNQLLADLHNLEVLAESRLLSNDVKIQKERVVLDWERTSLLEETSWHQKS